MMINLPRISAGDPRIDTPLHDMPGGQHAVHRVGACDDRDGPHGTAQGRRLRNWLIAGNIMGWALILVAARALFS